MSSGYRVEFKLPSDPRGLRTVHDDVVTILDHALGSAVPGGEVLHAVDPKRILTFAFGGPPVWSVAVVTHPSGVHQFLTYGLSKALDPAQPFGFELTMRVRSPGEPPSWPTLLLRHVARYQLSSGREIKPGESWCLGGPISRSAVPRENQHLLPDTRMDTVFVAAGPTLPTPRGPVEIRNLVGLDPSELELLETSRTARFLEELRRVDPSLTVDLDSPSLADNPAFRGAIEASSQREGGDCKAYCIPGFSWRDDGSAFSIDIPAAGAAGLRRRLDARLPFGEALLVHGTDPGPGSEGLIVPGEGLDVPQHDAERLVLVMSASSPQLQFLRSEAAVWTLRYA